MLAIERVCGLAPGEGRKEAAMEALAALSLNDLATRCSPASNADWNYQHDNSFFKLLLWQSCDMSLRLRLHIWPGSAWPEKQYTNVHGHKWDFCSRIVRGSLFHRVWEQSPLGEKFHHYLYGGRGTKTSYDMEYIGVSGLAIVAEEEFRDGQVYWFDKQGLHDVRLNFPEPCITLVLQDNHCALAHTHVYSRAPYHGAVPSPALPTKKLEQLWEECRAILKDN